jgi:hypothetical protein
MSASVLMLFSSPIALASTLATHIAANTSGTIWTYTLFNDEPNNSPNYIAVLALALQTNIFNITAPAGWDHTSDNSTFIQWFNTDNQLPYTNDIAPGASLGGFGFESTTTTSALVRADVGSWDHVNDLPGPPSTDVMAPVPSTEGPEPWTFSFVLAGLIVFVCVRSRPSMRPAIADAAKRDSPLV